MSAHKATNLKQGKKRKQNFDSVACNLLVNIVEHNLDTLLGQFSSTITNAKKQKLWETITSQINSYEKRTPMEIRKKWRNMAQVDKKKTSSGIMLSQRKTGGRSAAKAPANITAKIISLEPDFALLVVSFRP